MPSKGHRRKHRGLGDTIAAVTEKTGIKAAVEYIAKAIDVPCGCAERQEKLNNIVPYKQE